ncbi:sulfatase-like hydrolase/transferase [Maribacter sp. X9]|uniref:sulfatase-like hydrolase/transferase n=1 Tax=Maribacter sp. X9 TaxID=3402159 RepID=UPI003AF34D1D
MKTILKISMITLLLASIPVKAQQKKDKSPNVFLISLDGVRWQDVFTGIDTVLLNSPYTHEKKLLKQKFVGRSTEENRTLLMPFFWNTIAKEGQLHGNRTKGSKVNLTNTMAFSYPGYNEILTGKADDENINSNSKIYNKNKTLLELANDSKQYKGKVAAFASWDVFPYIINDKRSGVPVNAGYMDATGDLNEQERFLNEIQRQAPVLWESVRLDVFTHHFAKEYIKKNHPEVVYISYGETDDFAHGGLFDFYIKSLNNTDKLIQDLWQYVQNDPFYKDNTYFIITTDHGRGVGVEESSKWTDHGTEVKGGDQTWMALLGPEVKATGEVGEEQLYTNQIAPTIMGILNLKTDSKTMPGKALDLKFP